MQSLKIKVFLVVLAFVLFMLLTMGMYWWNIVAFRERLIIMDEFHDVVSDILETRRYEKNFMFYPEPGSLGEALVYLDRAEHTVALLQAQNRRDSGPGHLQRRAQGHRRVPQVAAFLGQRRYERGRQKPASTAPGWWRRPRPCS